MTENEIIDLCEEMHGAGLGNAPKDAAAAVKVWRDFFGGDDPRVIGKAVWIHMRRSQFWPTPKDVERLKRRAEWVLEIEQREYLEARQKMLEPPTAPELSVKDNVENFCDLCRLCDERDQANCPCDF